MQSDLQTRSSLKYAVLIALNEFGTTCWWRKGLDMFLGGIFNTGCSKGRTQNMIHVYVSIVMYEIFS